jgi:hypothetical protein
MSRLRYAAVILHVSLLACPMAAAEMPDGQSVRAPATGGPKQAVPARNCFWQLRNGSSRELVCEYKSWLTDDERADLKRLTREFLLDARCKVDVRIERRLVRDAMTAPDNVFTSPPQPVTCTVDTARGALTITGTFSPRVVFKGGIAVEGSPGLADIKGVNGYLAWPVVEYVNRSARIRDGMLGMVNAYLGRKAANQATKD